MPASAANDKLRKATPAFATTLSSSITNVATTIPLASTTGLPTDTAVIAVIDATDANGVATPNLKEVVVGEVSGTNLVNCLRGQDSTTAQSHNSAATVVDDVTALHWNGMVDWALVSHRQDGQHKFTVVYDSNGNEALELGAVASAVVNLKLYNAATGNRPVIQTNGEAARGIDFTDQSNVVMARLDPVASGVNFLRLLAAATTNPAELQAQGSDTNIDLLLTPKGAGRTRTNALTRTGLRVAQATKTGAYTLTDTDDHIFGDAAGGAFSLTLPTAVGKAGQRHTVTKIDTGANVLTLATTSSQTIDGITTFTLIGEHCSVTVESDGTNWRIVAAAGQLASYTPTLGGTSAALGNGTIVGKFVKVGRWIEGYIHLTVGTTTNMSTSGLTLTAPAPAESAFIHSNGSPAGHAHTNDTGVVRYQAAMIMLSASIFSPLLEGSAGPYSQPTGGITTTVPFTWGDTDSLNAEFKYPTAT